MRLFMDLIVVIMVLMISIMTVLFMIASVSLFSREGIVAETVSQKVEEAVKQIEEERSEDAR